MDAYNREIVERGAELGDGPEDRPHGLCELGVRDIDGVPIVFGPDNEPASSDRARRVSRRSLTAD